jgi:endonuclease/exonuclease/phosphatase family metal-dependent hydrolase
VRRVLLLLGLAALLGCAEEAPREWRLVSYNAWGVPLSQELERRWQRLPAALAALEPDVICLQEVWLPSQHEALAAGFKDRYHVARAAGGGLFLASRFPLRDESFTPFPAFEGLSIVERIARKGWLEAVVEAPGGPVRVVTTHLALEGPRHLQLDVLLAHLEGRRDLPLVLAGDLNTAASDPTFARLTAQGFVDPRGGAIEPPTRVGWPRRGGAGGWSPDHVLLRGLRAARFRLALDTPESALSDHNLLAVDLAR